jgi:hypothetical protein
MDLKTTQNKVISNWYFHLISIIVAKIWHSKVKRIILYHRIERISLEKITKLKSKM